MVLCEANGTVLQCCSNSPAVKRRRGSGSARHHSNGHNDDDDVLSPRSTMSPTERRSPVFSQSSSADRRRSSVTDRGSSERMLKDASMNPRVTVSPLRSINVRPSVKTDSARFTDIDKPPAGSKKAKLSDRARSSSGSEKKKLGSESGRLSTSSEKNGAQRRRSRNMQLTSLFDSLTRFFSADSDRRRRTAYVNATVSLAQSSLNPRHSFSIQQQPATVASQKTHQPVAPKARKQSVKQIVPSTSPTSDGAETKTKSRRGRKPKAVKCQAEPANVKTVKAMRREAANNNVKALRSQADYDIVKQDSSTIYSAHGTTDAAEMNDLLMASVAESESKLFHTAQTIAQQVIHTCRQ